MVLAKHLKIDLRVSMRKQIIINLVKQVDAIELKQIEFEHEFRLKQLEREDKFKLKQLKNNWKRKKKIGRA